MKLLLTILTCALTGGFLLGVPKAAQAARTIRKY